MTAGTVAAFCALAGCFAFALLVVTQRRPSPGVVIYSKTHYGGQRSVLAPGTAAPPFQPASIFVPKGLQAVLLLTPGVNRVTISPGSSVAVFSNVQPGTTCSSIAVNAVS